MSEPKYDEDLVNLGYLKRVISDTEEGINIDFKNVSRHYGSQPIPPYYEGDTWVDGNIVYTCINTRLVGSYTASDWVTESGALQRADNKSKVFLTQPSNYKPGDMWILQSDNDHRAGKKGEILITTAGRAVYDSDDWINMLGYGTIRSINEVADNLNNAITRIGVVEEAIEDGIIITFYQASEPEGVHIGDLWYVTGEVTGYIEGKIYRYNGSTWDLLDDPAIQEAFDEANNARLVADGKIQSFYSASEPTSGDIGVGDLWIDTDDNNKLYRYNGTNWVACYDTRIDDLVETVEETTERVTSIETDLGEIDLTVSETTTRVTTVEGNITNLQAQIDGAIQFWNGSVIPTLSNYPANEWTTEALKNNHRADIYTVIQDVSGELKQGKSYRFDKVGSTWQWVELTDNELSAVQALANSKAKVFITTPTVPYSVGDLWLKDGKLYRCKTAKDANGSYSINDWEEAVEYTDDTAANLAKGLANTAQTTANGAVTAINAIKDTKGQAEGKYIYLDDSSDDTIISAKFNGETSQETTILPDTYQQVDYIQMDRTNPYLTCIATGIPINTISKINFKYALTNVVNNSPMVFTAYTPESIGSITPYICVNGTVSGSWSISPTISKDLTNTPTEFTITNSNTTTNLLKIGGWGDNNWTAIGRYYYVKIYNTSNALIFNGIPCYRKSDNVVGMYDLVTNTFFENARTGTYTKGSNTSLPSPDYPSEIKNLEGRNKINVQDYSGTLNYYYAVQVTNFKLEEGKTYTFSLDVTSSVGSFNVSVGCGNGAYQRDIATIENQQNGRKIITFTPTATDLSYGKDFCFRAPRYTSSQSGVTYSVSNIQLEESLTATPYAPYNSLEVKVVNKNIFNEEQLLEANNWTKNNEGFYTGTIGNLHLMYSSNNGGFKFPFKFKENTQYTLSLEAYSTLGNNNSRFQFVYTDGTISSPGNFNYTSSHKISGKSIAGKTIKNISTNYSNTGSDVIYIKNIQLEENEETDYETYQEQTVYFPLAEGQKLYEGSYLADDGIHNVRGQMILDGTENWTDYTATPDGRYATTTKHFGYSASFVVPNTFKCSHFVSSGGATVVNGIASTKYAIYVNMSLDIAADLNAFVTWLQSNPVTVEYELAEEEIIPYNTEQQAAWNNIKSLHTYKTVTHIYSDAYAEIGYIKDNGLDIYETKHNANRKYTETTEKFAQQQITNESITNTVSQTITTVSNNYQELKSKFDDYAPVSDVVSLQTSVEQIQTNTYTKTEVNEKLTDGSVTKVSTTSGTFDSNGLTIEKTDAKTKGRFNETGIKVMDATSGTDQELLFAGYDEDLNETIVRTKNITVEKYLTLKNTARMEYYENPVLGGHGIGTFIL